MRQQSLLYASSGSAAMAILLVVGFGPWRQPSYWFTADQQADRLLRQGQFAAAAKLYTDSARQGVADYRAGDFKAAATAFSQASNAQAAYNQANSLVMLGKYADAVKAYDRALKLAPHWQNAADNRAIVVIRRDRLETKGGDEVGGQLAPDEIIYDKNAKNSDQSVQVNDGPPLSDADLQALWLRRVQTKPADFLRAKFAYQAARQKSEGSP